MPKKKVIKKKKIVGKKPVKKPRTSASKKKAPAARPAAKPQPSAPAAEKEPVLAWRQPIPGETFIGTVEDYYAHINVIALKLEQPLAVGDRIHVRGHTTDLTQMVESMQIGHQSVQQAGIGDSVGIKMGDRCRTGDYVYRVQP